jgi:hypothetical protein
MVICPYGFVRISALRAAPFLPMGYHGKPWVTMGNCFTKHCRARYSKPVSVCSALNLTCRFQRQVFEKKTGVAIASGGDLAALPVENHVEKTGKDERTNLGHARTGRKMQEPVDL